MSDSDRPRALAHSSNVTLGLLMTVISGAIAITASWATTTARVGNAHEDAEQAKREAALALEQLQGLKSTAESSHRVYEQRLDAHERDLSTLHVADRESAAERQAHSVRLTALEAGQTTLREGFSELKQDTREILSRLDALNTMVASQQGQQVRGGGRSAGPRTTRDDVR